MPKAKNVYSTQVWGGSHGWHQIFMKQSEAERDKAAYEKGYTDYGKLIEKQIALSND